MLPLSLHTSVKSFNVKISLLSFLLSEILKLKLLVKMFGKFLRCRGHFPHSFPQKAIFSIFHSYSKAKAVLKLYYNRCMENIPPPPPPQMATKYLYFLYFLGQILAWLSFLYSEGMEMEKLKVSNVFSSARTFCIKSFPHFKWWITQLTCTWLRHKRAA